MTIVFALSISLGLLLAHSLPAASAENLLPASTVAVFTVPDAQRLRAAMGDMPLAHLWRDEAMKAFSEKFSAGLRQHILDPLQKEAGFQLDEYLDLAQGQITLAVTFTPADAKMPGVVAIVDSGNKADALAAKLKHLRQTLTDRRVPFKSRTVRGIDFLYLTAPRNEQLGMFVGRSDSLLIAANNEAALDAVLLAQSGGAGKRLADLPAFQRLRETQFRGALALGWVDFSTVLEKIQQVPNPFEREKENPNDAPRVTPDQVLTALGLKGLRTVSFSYKQDGGDWAEMRLDVPAKNRRGLFKMFAPEPADTTPPPFVGTETTSYMRWRINGRTLWSQLVETALDIAPQVDGVIKLGESAAQTKDPKFRFKESLFDTLGTDVIRLQLAPRGETVEAQLSPPSVYFIESQKPNATLTAINTLLSVAGLVPEMRDADGKKIYTHKLPGLRGAREQVLHLTTNGGYLVVATDLATLEALLRGAEDPARKPLRDLPGLNEAVAKVGGYRTGWLGVENDKATAQSLLEFLRKNPTFLDKLPVQASLKFTLLDRAGKGLPLDWLDFKLLPAFEKVEKYFSHTAYSVSADEEGIRLRIFSPTPAALKK